MARNFKHLISGIPAKVTMRHLNPIWTRITTRFRNQKSWNQGLQQALETVTAERDEALLQGWTKETQYNIEKLQLQNMIQTLQDQVQELEALLTAVPAEEEAVGEESQDEGMIADDDWENPGEDVEWEEGWLEDDWMEPERVVIDISSEAPSPTADSDLRDPDQSLKFGRCFI